ncbi:endo-1,4-beta-xylanase [Neobacillus bataviensis]|uniref:Beta-xylanase n=1 Tax=Neobacillus bataviensis TaxID=220685 RepID=A0A561CUR8_9BACI|nr:endo-1,4-beta-xylanase [Neobacillus bataviensis]TWD94588.1 endo-1,4-beta-xylanase [Neobacillus bataviensis]
MKKKLKSLISLLLVASLVIPSGWIKNVAKAATVDIPVLLYHRIVQTPSNQWTDTSTDHFKQAMQYLDDNGYTTLSAEEYVNIMEGKETAPAKPVLLTFDDATPDFVTTALPVLKQYNMKSVLFVVSSWIGGNYSMSLAQLQSLVNEPSVSIENHSKTHNDKIWGNGAAGTSSMTTEQATDEIVTANTYLKALTSKDPVLLAYPYGSFNDTVKDVAQKNGIKYAFKVGYPNGDDYAMGRYYVLDADLTQIAKWVGGPAPTTTPTTGGQTSTQTTYHETFDSGQGVATKAGNPQIEAVSGKVFEGNDDGKAIYVSVRVNNWDSVDIPFSKIGMENGKTYTITVKGYVDDSVSVPAGAQALLQNVNSYNGLYVASDYKAGQAFKLTGEYTVDTSKDNALRIQSNDAGKTVPFYIGDILITEKVTSGGGSDPVDQRPAAQTFNPITFEDQTKGGFEGRAGTETLTVTNEENHTSGGSYALKVDGRTQAWNGPSLHVEKYVNLGQEYRISAWVKLISPESSQLQLSTQVGNGGAASYNNLQGKTINKADGWVKLEGTYRYTNAGGEYLTIYVESSNNATASFLIDDITFEPTGSGPIAIQDLTPIKDVYKNDFLIGNAVSLADLDGVRLDLLKKHFNIVTAENAMKPDQAYNADRQFDFTDEDALINKITAAGLKLHGHVLVWHQQTPTWLYTADSGQPLSRDEALANLQNHIKTVIEHYSNKVVSWDVVNEAINDGLSNPTDWKANLRQTGWYKAIGSDYVEQAFLAARQVVDEHGWNIKLYYNDYNEDNQNKAEAIYQMVKELNDRYAKSHPGKLLIDGVGMQSHYNLNTNPANVQASMEKFISLGVQVSVTELDIAAGSNSQLTEKQANDQAYLYAQLFNIYKDHKDHIGRVTFWGLNDATSWRAAQSPLVFDKNLQAKPAYYGVTDPDKFIAEHAPEVKVAKQSTVLFGTPTIDGTVDDVWKNAQELPVNHYLQAWQGANGVSKVLWDKENLYILTQVSDSQLDKSSPNPWEQDSVEVFVDENNTKTSSYENGDGQYRVNFDNQTSFNPGSIANGFKSATLVSGNSYVVEMKIPFKTVTPQYNTKIGFDVQINDGKDGARQSAATWNDTTGNGYQDTSVFGVLTLVDTTAPVTTDNVPTDWVNKDVTVDLTSIDNGSGVKATYYKIDNGTEQTGNSITISDEGVHTITYWSVDNAGNVEAQHSATVKIDKTAPTLNITLNKTTIWSPNHNMVPVTATISSADAASGINSVVLTSITSNEKLQSDDIQNAKLNTPITGSTASFELRADRLGNGNGRVYIIIFTATDKAGNVTTKSVNVTVTHDQSK